MKLTALLAALFGMPVVMFAQSSQAAQSGQAVMKVVVEPVGTSSALDKAVTIIPSADSSSSSAVTAIESSGAWSNNGGGPTMYSKNYWYGLILYPVGAIPSNARITSVSWSYAVSSHPGGFQALLCHNAKVQYCGNITSLGSGRTNDFFYGRAANMAMAFYFRVAGTGALYPSVYGQNDSVIVNWTAP